MTTPALGEVDWRYKWLGAEPRTLEDPPRSGYWKIDIYDVVMMVRFYRPIGIPPIPSIPYPRIVPLPGADLAPPVGRIDIYDIVSATGKYGITSMRHT